MFSDWYVAEDVIQTVGSLLFLGLFRQLDKSKDAKLPKYADFPTGCGSLYVKLPTDGERIAWKTTHVIK